MFRIHYKEYLVGLVIRNGIDPAEVMSAEELTVLLERAQKKIPRRGRDESVAQYTRRLLDVSSQEATGWDKSLYEYTPKQLQIVNY